MRLTVAIELEGPGHFRYSDSEWNADLGEVQDELSLLLMPHRLLERRVDASHFNETLAAFLFVSGSLTFLVRKFFDSIAAEAGKDAYAALKALIGKIGARNRTKTYRVYQDIWVSAKIGNEHAVLCFRLFDDLDDHRVHELRMGTASSAERAAAEELLASDTNRQIDAILMDLRDSWDEIEATIQKFHIGESEISDHSLHYIRPVTIDGKRKWIIAAVTPDDAPELPARLQPTQPSTRFLR